MRINEQELDDIENIVRENPGNRICALSSMTGIDRRTLHYRLTLLVIRGRLKIVMRYGLPLFYPVFESSPEARRQIHHVAKILRGEE